MALIGIVCVVIGWFLVNQAMDLMTIGFKMIIKYLKG